MKTLPSARYAPTLCKHAAQQRTRLLCTHPHRSGFALVVSLVLMGFMLMLVLSLSTLVQTEISKSSVETSNAQARSNALLGVYTALSQLQEYAGQDQRATARADIGDENIANPYWTGVWSSTAKTVDGETVNTPKLLTYLVSGNQHSGAPLRQEAKTALNKTRSGEKGENFAVVLATDGSGSEVLAQSVRIESGNTSGAYAYWISDEGVKAKLNLPPVQTPADAAHNFALLTPQHYGFHNVAGIDDWLDQSAWFSGDALIPAKLATIRSLLSIESISALDPAPGQDPRSYRHDLTAYSYGVLSNQRTGGLKKDLTAALSAGSIHSSLDNARMATAEQPASWRSNAPLWNQLHSWVRQTAATLPVQSANNQRSGQAPVLLGYQLYFFVTYKNDAAQSDPNKRYPISNRLVPAVALWNPYDKPLEQKNYRIVAGRISRSSTDVTARPFLYDIEADGAQGMYIHLKKPDGNFEDTGIGDYGHEVFWDKNASLKGAIKNELFDAATQRYTGNTLEFEIPNVKLNPGQIKIYTPASNTTFSGAARTLSEGGRLRGYSYALNGSGTQRYLFPVGGTDPLTAEDPIARMKVRNRPGASMTRVGGLQLFSSEPSGTPSGVLSEALYLNLTLPTYPADLPPEIVVTEETPTLLAGDLPLNGRAYGWNVLRNIGWNPGMAMSGRHRELSDGLNAHYKWIAHYNPRAVTSGPHPANYTVSSTDYNGLATQNPSFVSSFDFWGENTTALMDYVDSLNMDMPEGIVLFQSSPGIANLFSIGQLTHAPLYYWQDSHGGTSYDSDKVERMVPRLRNSAFDNLIPAYAIGNSKANPAIELGKTSRDIASLNNPGSSTEREHFQFTGTLHDYSYLLNEALWDDYFFSAITTDGTDAAGNTRYQSRNPRLVPVFGKTLAAAGVDTSAQNLLIDGAFNVNSTSVNAWKALLTSFYGRTPAAPNRIANQSSSDPSAPPPALSTPFLRVDSHRNTTAKPAPGIDEQEAYTGYRALSSQQIDDLARAIVEQIRLRGVAPSLGAFVNRSLSAEDAPQRVQGVLAAAIESANLNSKLSADLTESKYTATKWQNLSSSNQAEAAAEGHITEGLPGWLTPADLLSRLGAVLLARSDTFLIRAYGESSARGQKTPESRVWCEALVQRLPEELTTGQPPANNFGRRFAIIGFRWLGESDI